MTTHPIHRRGFNILLGSVVTWPLVTHAQQANNTFRIGYVPLGLPTSATDQSYVEAFRRGLRDVGLVENRDVTIDITWVANESDYSQAISQLLQRGAMLLVTGGSTATAAAQRITSTIPIIFAPVGNPVGTGFVASLSHPGGNITGFSDVLADLSSKYVQFGIELGKPKAPIEYLWHTDWPDGKNRLDATARAAQSLGVELRSRGFANVDEVNDVLTAMKNAGAVSVVVQPSPLTNRYRVRLIESGMARGLGMIMAWPVAAREGALIGYGPDYADMYRRVGAYILRIIKGEKPANLPVQEPTKFPLLINTKSAKAIGVSFPPAVVVAADEVID
jgi:putative tryptophan/tyrosine transport system substrate-binding protein